jgi:hypothetical protein
MNELKLHAPQPAASRRKGGDALAEEFALEAEVLHFVAQDLLRHRANGGIVGAQIEGAVVDLRDEFGGQ